jgi:hypothetical protein
MDRNIGKAGQIQLIHPMKQGSQLLLAKRRQFNEPDSPFANHFDATAEIRKS